MLSLQIITPEKVVYKNDVDEVLVPTSSGQIAILTNHVGLITQVAPGEVIVKKGKEEHPLAITGGFLEVKNNSVSILADYAVRAEDIEVLKAQEAQKRAEKLMEEKTSNVDFRTAQADLLRALTELQVANRHRRKSPRTTQI